MNQILFKTTKITYHKGAKVAKENLFGVKERNKFFLFGFFAFFAPLRFTTFV
jgi:hypothetical protein